MEGKKIKILTWIIIVLTGLAMILSLLFRDSGTIVIIIYTALVVIQSNLLIWLLKKEI